MCCAPLLNDGGGPFVFGAGSRVIAGDDEGDGEGKKLIEKARFLAQQWFMVALGPEYHTIPQSKSALLGLYRGRQKSQCKPRF